MAKDIFGKGVNERQEGGIFPLLVAPLLLECIFGKGVTRAGRGYDNMNHMDKIFYFRSILKAISRLLRISITNLGLMAFFQGAIYLEKNLCVINLDDKQSKGTHWFPLFTDTNATV